MVSNTERPNSRLLSFALGSILIGLVVGYTIVFVVPSLQEELVVLGVAGAFITVQALYLIHGVRMTPQTDMMVARITTCMFTGLPSMALGAFISS